MATHSSTLAWKIPWTEEPGGLQSMGTQRVGHDWTASLSRIGEGHGNPLQCSCLENPRDGGAWWAAVYGVAQRQTGLIRLSSSSRELRKMVTMTLFTRQQKRHRCKEQTFGLCGRRQGWDDLKEAHWSMYIIICEIDRQSRFDAWVRVLRAGALGWPWGMGWGGRWEGGSGCTCTPMADSCGCMAKTTTIL